MSREYVDFDLLFQTRPDGGYEARVVESPAGPSSRVTFDSPVGQDDLDVFLQVVGRPRRRVRGRASPAAQAVEALGGQMFDTVFRGEVRDRLISSLDLSRRQGCALRLRLRLGDTPELVDLPWECLYDTSRRAFLALSEWTPVVRYLDLPGPDQSLRVAGPLNVLVMIAQHGGYAPLDVQAEWDKLEESVKDLRDSGRLTLVRLPAGNLVELQRALRRGTFHIFHFIGHGLFDTDTGGGQLIMEGPHGQGAPVSGEVLARRLGDHRTLRLVVLNSCEGARTDLADPFAGTAQAIVLQGVPAVVAMQFEIADSAAVSFSQGLYEALADGSPVDDATTQARQMIESMPNPVEWITPVLYMRAADGHLFDIAPESGITARSESAHQPAHGTPSSRPSPTDPEDADYAAALSAYFTGRWAEAINLLATLAERRPADGRIATKLEEARKQQALGDTYRRAQNAGERNEWEEAASLWAQVVELDPTFRDAATQLEEAKRQQEAGHLVADIRHLYQAANWAAVVTAGQRLAELGVQDAELMVSEAHRKMDEARVAARYTDGLHLLDREEWAAARDTFAEIEASSPGYQAAAELRVRAEQEIERSDTDQSSRGTQAGERTHVPVDKVRGSRRATAKACDPYAPKPRVLPVVGSCALAFSTDGRRLLTGGLRWARLWDLDSGDCVWQYKTRNLLNHVNDVALSPDGTRAALATADGGALMLNAKTGVELKRIWSSPRPVQAVTFHPHDPWLATAGGDGTVRIWDFKSRKQLLEINHGTTRVMGVGFSPDGTRIVTATSDGTARICDTTTGHKLLRVRHTADEASVAPPLYSAAFSPDGARFATASEDGTAWIWDASSGRRLTLVRHSKTVSSVSFDPDSPRLATASHDRTTRVWDASSGGMLLEIPHKQDVLDVSFAPDGTAIATASRGSAQISDAGTAM